MQIIIPMTGQGARFKAAGYATHKALLRVDGKPVIEHVLDIFPGEEDVLFICDEKHLNETPMGTILHEVCLSADIVGVPAAQKGPVFAVMQAIDKVKDDEPVFISYCDYGQDWDYDACKKILSDRNIAGAVPCYTGFHPHLLRGNLYAGVLRDENGLMRDIKEKHRFTEKPEDSYHSSGSYYFQSGALMKKYFAELMESDININGEYYVSSAYELLLRDQLLVYVPEITHFKQWGTPEDLEEYEAWSRTIHQTNAKEKPPTDIPLEREPYVLIPYADSTEEFRNSYEYWKRYL